MVANSKVRAWGAAVVALAAAVVVAALALTRGDDEIRVVTPPQAAACAKLPVDLDGLWHPAARRALLARNPAATTTAAWLADVIDHDATAWPAQRRAACGRGLGERASLARLDAAARCLADRRAALVRAIGVGPLGASELVAAALALRDPAACVDVAGGADRTVELALVAADRLAAEHQLDAAIATITQTLPALRAQADPRALVPYARALTRAAKLHAAAGRADDALATARSALIVQERIYGAEHAQLLELLQAIGAAQRDLGQLEDARATGERVRAIEADTALDPPTRATVDRTALPSGGAAGPAVDATRAALRARR